jgi:hypothetical protein
MDVNDNDPLDDLCDTPLEVSALRHAVVLAGPDGVALAMTIKAAEASIIRLRQAIGQAKGGSR